MLWVKKWGKHLGIDGSEHCITTPMSALLAQIFVMHRVSLECVEGPSKSRFPDASV